MTIRQPGAEIHFDPDGLASTTEVYRGSYNDMIRFGVLRTTSGLTYGKDYRSPHPEFPSLMAFTIKIARGQGLINGTLTIEYRGLNPALSSSPPPIYTLETTTGNEPLMTHPKFFTPDMAGTPDLPANGAQFQSTVVKSDGTSVVDYNPTSVTGATGPGVNYNASTATFYQWLADSEFAGIEDYLTAGIIFKKSYTSYSFPVDASKVGTFSNPDGPAPLLSPDYQWFFLGESSEDNAGLFRNEATWKVVPAGTAANVIYGP